ncbi:MAG: T9SS type A sorting domain-containing protein [Saprospiraceae bacterium]|nr:T9SS type A sorting domain-containing protein [Saprospiraceae bacterium]MCF8248390.1 T9SS type A sorting domain-containing protein [Saprospiraceae bacterium]MCF8280061.1 T9SS type A sorting domain-containing protein [Bacteroidales bacterium]MCF8309918.1 T9SS type A sorting domain-containing protein [Saprospiraceae bacterium]MCF8438751.1 T9SS type A sorting domain-containing protein [Saprospiraceae bacterium]
MKIAFYNVSFIVVFLLLNSRAIGQELFGLEPDYHYVTPAPNDTLVDPYNVYHAISDFIYNEEETIYLKWQLVVPSDCPAAWRLYIADTQLHYWPVGTTTNLDTLSPFSSPMPLGPDWVGGNTFELAVFPQQVKGCCTVQVLFSMADEPDNILEVVTYDIAMVDSSCFVSAQNIVVVEDQLLVSPNPASESIQVAASKPIVSTRMFNIMGRIVTTSQQQTKPQIAVGDLPNGTYFLQIELQGGRLVYETIMVQH